MVSNMWVTTVLYNQTLLLMASRQRNALPRDERLGTMCEPAAVNQRDTKGAAEDRRDEG